MQTIAKSNVTVTECAKCKAPHFNYQLTCKRCGIYLQPADRVGGPNSHQLAIAGGIAAVSTIILIACAVIHAF